MRKFLLLATLIAAFSPGLHAQQFCTECKAYIDGMECVLIYNNAYCACEVLGRNCDAEGICSFHDEPPCQEGTIPVQEMQAKAKAIIDRHKTTIAMLLHPKCAKGQFGKALREEAARQGKEIHIMSPPSTLTAEEMDDYNQLLHLWNQEMRRLTAERDAAWNRKHLETGIPDEQ